MYNHSIFILFADDDEEDRNFFEEALQQIPVKTQLQTVPHGKDLIEYLTDPYTTVPDYLFLDLNMPFKSGLQCISEMKKINYLKDIPIIIYSTHISDQQVEEVFEKGATAYIQKPNNFYEIQKILIHIIALNWEPLPSITMNPKYSKKSTP